MLGPATTTCFDLPDGGRKSVAEYFSERYGALQFPKFPVLHVGSKRRAAFIPLEVCCLYRADRCFIVIRYFESEKYDNTTYIRCVFFQHCVVSENQKAMKKLTERQTSTMIKVSRCLVYPSFLLRPICLRVQGSGATLSWAER